MSTHPKLNGWTRHFLLSIQLNFQNGQAVAYAYLVPLIFLLAFGSVFRGEDPPLLGRMGQLVTITILGGACFGLPTALVAERERGIWRRYRLLPVSTPWLILSTMLSRLVIVASSVLVQVAFARAVFGTPLPVHPGAALLAFLLVTAAFLGLGFLIAGLANDVPAVQALGQCIFLPMILIGGVGVPLAVLPVWAQRLAGFMPGRYAVEVLQPCFNAASALDGAGFRFGALTVIGLAAGLSGARLFRWEGDRRASGSGVWVGAALLAWVAVGALAWSTGRLDRVVSEATAWSNITEAEIAGIHFDGLPPDGDIVSTLAPASLDTAESRELDARLARWSPSRLSDDGQSIRNLVALASVADLSADPREGTFARLVFRQIRSRFDGQSARQGLAWIILSPDDGSTITKAPELGLFRHPPERLIRQRSVIFAKKYLGRLVGKIPD